MMKASPVIISTMCLILIAFLPVKGINKCFQYNQTSNNFLDTNGVKFISITDAAETALQFIPGFITKAELIYKKEHPVWKLNLTTIQNGVVKFEISAVDKNLIRMESDEGPFEYEISPGKSFIYYSGAKKIAEEKTNLKILKWNFFRNKNKWEYNFWMFTKSGKAQLRVDAESGEILSNKKNR